MLTYRQSEVPGSIWGPAVYPWILHTQLENDDLPEIPRWHDAHHWANAIPVGDDQEISPRDEAKS